MRVANCLSASHECVSTSDSPPHAQALVPDMWRLCDRDHDGLLNREEFPLLMVCIQQARLSGGLPTGPLSDAQVHRLTGAPPQRTGSLVDPAGSDAAALSPALRDLLGLGFSLEQAKVGTG